jgi:ATP-dependent DNA ligase
VDHIGGNGRALFRAACKHDLEGIVAKWRHGVYQVGGSTNSWLLADGRTKRPVRGSR